MKCADCAKPSTYDLRCGACRARLVRSCRSAAAPRVAREQQEIMLALIARFAGEEARNQTVRELRAENGGRNR